MPQDPGQDSHVPLVEHASAAIERGSSSFAAAARLFDARTRESTVMLYAWCRHCDDTIDGQQLGHGQRDGNRADALARLARLRACSDAVFRGEPPADAVHAALAEVVRRHDIAQSLVSAHLDGFAMDVAGRRYRTFDDTLEYCYHVAGVVGIMMAIIMGVRDDATLDRACDLGLALQLTNIARDVLDDAAIGRVYLPEEWLAAAGLSAETLADPMHRAALAGVVARLLDAAEPFYDSSRLGLRALPARCAWAVAAARGVYRQIGLKVRASGERAWDARVTTSRSEKVRHVMAAAGTAFGAATLGRCVHPPARASNLWARP